ncbi:MAG: hypothetical protein E6H10_15170 [Bacteroidetes bacterium]|nr:MAG: hypothetical protein E6H10_15170 [Bacteroidota bacterium]
MKSLKTFATVVLLVVVASVWTACKKEVSQQAAVDQSGQQGQNAKEFGAVKDDIDAISKVHLIVSSQFLAQDNASALLQAGSRGKPTRGGGGTGDVTAPTISITSPGNGSTVGGTIGVQVNATDNVGVNVVYLYVDNAQVGSSVSPPFTISWNSASVGNGTHTLVAKAKDAAGNMGASSSASVNVSNSAGGDLVSPTASITSPSNGSAFDPNINVSVGVSGNDNIGVTSVKLYADGSLVGTSNSASATFSWNTGSISGPHTLTAYAFDAANNQGSASISITVNTTVINPPSLPSSVSLTMPPVQYQGAESGCVPVALLYSRDAEQYYKTGASSYSTATNIFSPEFLYNQTKVAASCSSGASLINELNFLTSTGVCTWNSMPYSDQNGCTLLPTAQQTSEAANYKIKSYSMVVAQDPTAIKTMLYNKHPLTFTFTADANFYNAGPGYIWSSYSSTLYGPHAITLVGYDDSKHAYRAINQWGTGWGDGGYIWIDYAFFATIAYDLYAQSL